MHTDCIMSAFETTKDKGFKRFKLIVFKNSR